MAFASVVTSVFRIHRLGDADMFAPSPRAGKVGVSPAGGLVRTAQTFTYIHHYQQAHTAQAFHTTHHGCIVFAHHRTYPIRKVYPP